MNPHPQTSQLPKQNPGWNNLPTKAVRVPEKFLLDILRYARTLDRSGSGLEVIIDLLDTLTQDELRQIKLAVDCLVSDDPQVIEIQLSNDHKATNTVSVSRGNIGNIAETRPPEDHKAAYTANTAPTPLDNAAQIQPSNDHKAAYTANTASVSRGNIAEIQLSDDHKAAYTEALGFVPSKYQLNIVNWINRNQGNACCNAVAGAGKSSSLLLIAKTLQQLGISPHEIKVCVFGKENSKDLIKKFGVGWKSSISTLHSAGWSLIKQELQIWDSHLIEISSRKYKKIAESFGLIRGKNSRTSLLTSNKIVKESDVFFKLLDLLRLCNLTPTVKNLHDLCYHYKLEGLLESQKAADYLHRCLRVGEQQAANKICFDFTDQLWLPIKWRLTDSSWFKPYKFVLVDECQDLNATQLELVCGLAGHEGRILAVGDPRQAIMGFAGADCDSYAAIMERTQAVELPLSICYRCPTEHIALVKKLFPTIEIEPSPTAKPGTIKQIKKEEIMDHVKDLDMVLSRKTAPLVPLCLKLIANKKKAQIKGRAIGDNLKNELKAIENNPYFSWSEFNYSLDIYLDDKCATYKGNKNEEQLKENLIDKIEAIGAIYRATPHAKNVKDLEAEIDNIFSDENAPITLSTCHRAKGLEAQRIFIYEPQDMPMEWRGQKLWQYDQEMNLLYVALTRSKSELFIVGECGWYRPKPQCTQQSDVEEEELF